MKTVGANALIVFALSVAAWLFFDVFSERLEPRDTLVVVLVITLAVVAARRIVERVRRRWRATRYEG